MPRHSPDPSPPDTAPGGFAPNPDALDRLYEEHGRAVERWVRRLAGPFARDTEDMIHDVFVIALRQRSRFRGESKITTWLFGIAENVVRRRRRRERWGRLLGQRYEQALVALPPSSPTPLEQVERRQEVGRLYRALDRLPDKYRTVLVMCDVDGLAAAEVAGLLGLSANAVWVRVHRGRARLQAELLRSTKAHDGGGR